jgi:hypothetical protein
MIALLLMCFRSSRDPAMIDRDVVTDVHENVLDSVGAAAAFRRAAQRGIDAAHPRRGRATRNGGFYLSVAQDVAAADDHDSPLAAEPDKDHDQQ